MPERENGNERTEEEKLAIAEKVQGAIDKYRTTHEIALTDEMRYRLVEERNTLDEQKGSLHGDKKAVSLRAALDVYKQYRTQEITEGLEVLKERENARTSAAISNGIREGYELLGRYFEGDERNIAQRAERFEEFHREHSFSTRQDYWQENKATPQASHRDGQMICVLNSLSQMHHRSPKPGFFSRLFNTAYNKNYNREEAVLKSLKNSMSHLDRNFVEKISSASTCYDQIDLDEVENVCNGVKDKSNSYLRLNSIDVQKLVNAEAKNISIDAVWREKDPFAQINEYLKKNEDYLKNLPSKDKGKEQFEIAELGAKKQGVQKDGAQKELKAPVAQKEELIRK